MKRKFSPVSLALGLISARAAAGTSLPALIAISMPIWLLAGQAAAAPAIQTGGSVSVNGAGAILDGQNGNGYFVQGGNLTISNATLTNFATKGGDGSGGGAGLGGAVFVNSGATVILNNVNLLGNTAAGGAGGGGATGGTLNNLFTGGSTGTAGSNGYTPTQTSFTDIGGTTGTKGYNGAYNASGFGGIGGIGGAGGNGGDRSISLILGATSASADLAGWVSQLAADSANPFTANVAIGLTLSVVSAGINLGSAVTAVVDFDKSLSDGQIGLGGSGGAGGLGGQGGFGLGGGAGGTGGAGGVGGANWSGSAYNGGAAGGDAGDGGTGGLGGFGAGGGKGGDGGAAGHGAGFTGNAAVAAVPDVMGSKIIPAIYAQQYTDPVTHLVVTVPGKDNLNSPSGEFTQSVIVSNGTTQVVTITTVKTFAEQTVSYIITPGSPAISATSPGMRPDGLAGAGGDGGAGGFGAGQGAGGTGNATQAAGGSGGDGMGGAIFVRAGGIVTIQGNAIIGQNVVRGGAGENANTATAAGSAGGAVGSDIFMMTGSSVTLAPGAGNIIKINGSIADDSAASITSPIPSGSGAGLTITSGLVILNGTNTYSGQTLITGGALQAQDGTGIYSDSHINFAGGVLQSSGDFIRLVGTDPSKVQWTGSGGFAATGGVLNVSLNDGFGQTVATQTWNSGGFVPTGSSLLFGSLSADSAVVFKNNINLNSGNRSILVQANLADAQNALAANVDTATLGGVLTNGSLTVGDASHTGILILTNANTYGSGTTINGGSLVLAKQFNPATGALVSTGSLNANGVMNIAGGANLDFSQTGNQAIGDLSGAGSIQGGAHTLTLNQAAASTFAGVLADGGLGGGGGAGLIKNGVGVLTLAGANTYSGHTEISVGGITLDGSLTSASIHIAGGTILTNNSGGLAAAAALTNDGILNQNADDMIASLVNTGTINNAAHTLSAATYALNSGSIIHANLGGGSVLSNGIVALNGASAAATFQVQSGTTTLGSAERLLDTTALTIDSGANLKLGGDEKIGSLWGAGNLQNGGGLLTLDGGNFAGVIAGTGGLTKVTDGTLVLAGANTYLGSSLIAAGTLTLDGSLGSEFVAVNSGATLAVNAAGLAATAVFRNDGTASLAVADTVLSYVGRGTLNGPGQLNAGSYTLNDGALINANLGAGNLVTNGNVLLNGVSQSTNVTVTARSMLTLGGAQRLDAGAMVTVDGTLVLAGGNQVIYDLFGSGVVNANSYRFTVSHGGGNFTGNINAATTPLVSDGGDLKLNGGTTTTPATEVNNGSNLTVQNSGILRSNLITVSSGSTLTVDLTGVLDYDSLTGSGMVNALSGAFTNPTDSLVGGFLTFTGNYTNRGTLAPGNSPGLITIAGNYTEAAVLEAELESTTPITGHDQVRVGGSVTLLPSSTLVVQTYNNVLPVRGATYQVIADAAGGTKAVTGSFGSVRFDADGALGAGASVVNAAALFDQATGRVIATGLNDAGSTFADLGASTNQQRAASALFGSATGLVGPNQINTTTAAGALALQLVTANGGSANNLARFTPEFYGAIADYAMGNDLTITNLLHDRVSTLANLPGVPAHEFALYSGVMQQQLNTADDADIDRTDLYIGGDYAVSKSTTVGLLVMYNTGDFSAAYGHGDVDGFETDAYFKQSLNRDFDLVGRLGYGSYTNDLRRTTTDIVQAFGETDSSVVSGSLGIGYRGWTWGEFNVAPRADLTYSHASVDGFTETGANDRLALGAYDADHLIAQVGASLVWATKLAGRNFSVELNAGIDQSLMDKQDDAQVTVVSAPDVRFSQTFADDDQTRAAYGLNFGYSVCDQATIYAGYEGRASSNSSGNANAGLRVSF